MSRVFISSEALSSFPIETVRHRSPFPWFEFSKFLTPEGFRALYESFPSLGLFEQHSGLERAYGQRPHNRYYLAYEKSIYHQTEHPVQGFVKHEELSPDWQLFIREVETNASYHKLVKSLFEVSRFNIRFAWHVGFTNCEVSPHIDAANKIGTHMIYFNTRQDWKPEWGGSTLVLCDKSTSAMNPDFADFNRTIPIQSLDESSFIFKNAPNAWHGVKPLRCPEGKYRRLFNIIFEIPEARRKPSVRSSARDLLKRMFD